MPSFSSRWRNFLGAVAVLPVLIVFDPSSHQTENASGSQASTSLVVLIVVDQMRPDYLERFDADFEGGFRWLLDNGVLYPHARQDHALTQTAPGHSTLLSGRPPASTGIVSNARGVGDAQSPLIGSRRTGASPRRFRGSSLYDWMLARDSATRLLSVSRKDRGAILPVGRAQGEVYWYGYNGNFTTSNWYRDSLPDWLESWNARRGVARLAGATWDLLLPASRYSERDDYEFENRGKNFTFPHVLPGDTAALAGAIVDFPWMDSLVLDLALEGVRQTGVGQRGRPDLLAVSLSATDAVGHDFGPDSRETHDQLVRLDLWLGRFLDSLATLVPRERTIFAFASDHSVRSIPAFAREVRGDDAGHYWDRTTERRLRQQFESRWRTDFEVDYEYGLLSANTSELAARGIDVDSLSDTLARELAALTGVQRTYTPQTLAAAPPSDRYAELWRRHIPPDFEWLVVTVPDSNNIWSSGGGANHGAPELEEIEVPVIIVAPGHPSARHDRPVRITALGPTLAALIGVTPTEPVEQPLAELVGSGR